MEVFTGKVATNIYIYMCFLFHQILLLLSTVKFYLDVGILNFSVRL